MSIFKKNKKIATHDGTFHTDDIFAMACMQILFGDKISVTRTRDMKIIKSADIVFDVGGEYDEAQGRFDHHQIGGAGKRENDMPYASFGLVWKKYGEQICNSKKIAEKIDEKLVQSIDASDNGIDLFEARGLAQPFLIQNALYAFRPTWKESESYDKGFMKAVNIAKQILEREIICTRDALDAEEKVRKVYEESSDKSIIIFNERYPWEELLISYPEPLIAVAPRVDGKWKAETVAVKLGSFERRIKFPESWAGKRDIELAQISGVADAIFCHNGRFMAVALSKNGAIELAKKCLSMK